jgi:hypothetical protein
MGYASKLGRARISPSNPQAAAVCDRCGLTYNHVDLQFQWDYRGPNLANLRILVCDTCLDVPQPQLKPRIIPPDPRPIQNPRFEPYAIDEGGVANTMLWGSGNSLLWGSGNSLIWGNSD